MILSVITITYRDPSGLEKTIESLKPLLQSSLQWEHVIVDSSPTENERIFEQLPNEWPLVRLVEEAHGIYPAMNVGARSARGKMIWFLNGGDKLKDSSILSRLLAEMSGDRMLDMICAGGDLYRDGQYLYPRLPRQNFLRSIQYRNHLCHQGVLYKKTAFEKVGAFSEKLRLAADYEHYFRCYISGLRVECRAERLVECDLSGASAIGWKESLSEAAKSIAALKQQLPATIYLQNQIGCRLEFLRVGSLKAVRKFLPGEILRKAWLSWNRKVE